MTTRIDRHPCTTAAQRWTPAAAATVCAALASWAWTATGPAARPLCELTAAAVAPLLHALGIPVVRAGAALRAEGFVYEIDFAGTGLPLLLFVFAALVARPAAWRTRLAGFAAAVPLVLASNLARLVHLIAVGVRDPGAFGVVHDMAWPAVALVALLAWFAAWAAWAEREAGAAGWQ